MSQPSSTPHFTRESLGAATSKRHGLWGLLVFCASVQIACVDPPSVQPSGDMSATLDASRDVPDMVEMGGDVTEPDAARDAAHDVVDMKGDGEVIEDHPSCGEELPANSTRRFQAGSGVAGDPYILCTSNQLKLIAIEEKERVDTSREGAFYELGRDIELDPNKTWTPIPCLRGDLDGAGHRIVNLFVKELSKPSGCYVESFERVGGFVHNLRGKVHGLTFEHVRIGTELDPLPTYLGTTQIPYQQGGLFGNMISASLTDVHVKGLEAFVTWHFGGLAHTIVNTSLERVSLQGVTVHYGHGRVGGLAAMTQNTEPNGSVFEGVEVSASLLQNEALGGTVQEMTLMPVALLTALLHGAVTLADLSLTGEIQHEKTLSQQETILGGVAGVSFDLLPSTHTPEQIDALRSREIQIKGLTLRDFEVRGCQALSQDRAPSENEVTCLASGAIFGHIGRPAAQRGPLSTPAKIEQATIEHVTMRSARPGLLFGTIHEDRIMLTGVNVRHVHLIEESSHPEEHDGDCLWSEIIEGQEPASITATQVCIEQSTCAANTPATSQNCAP